MQRRDFLGALFTAPAIVKAENIMKLWVPPKVVPVSYAAGLAKSMELTQANFERMLNEVLAEGKPIRAGFKIVKDGDLWVAHTVPVTL